MVMRRRVWVMLFLIALSGAGPANAIAAEDVDARLKALETEVEALKRQLNSLTMAVETRPGQAAPAPRLAFGVEQVAPTSFRERYRKSVNEDRN